MAWDDGDKGNPWRPDKDKGPADLDAVVRDLQRRLAAFFGGGGNNRGGGEQALSSGLIASGAVLLVVVWAAFGFYRVDAAERGVVFRFGAFQGLTQPGLQWHWPWPIESREIINTGATERYPYRADNMLTRDENIVNVDLVVQYRRTDPQSYMFNLRAPEATLAAATASAIREVVGRNVLDFILTDGRTEIAAEAEQLLQATLDSYGAGITIYEVNLVNANFPGEVEAAVQDSIRAREDRARRILEAEAYSNEILPRARGEAARRRQEADAYREQVIADAEGESDRFTQILTEYQKAPGVTRERLYIETLEAILSTSTKVLVDTEGGNNLLYLPLDQLVQRRSSAPSVESLSPSVTVPPTISSTPRSRERETR